MIVVGFDPSTDGAAFAVLECGDERGRRLFVDCGEITSDPQDVEDILKNNNAAIVAVERPSGIHMHPKPHANIRELHQTIMMARATGSALMGASYVCGAIAAIAKRVQLIPYIELAPQQWRTALGVSRTTKDTNQDAMVKEAIQTLITGWPNRSNTHVRDAAGVALAAYWTHRSQTRRVQPGPEVFGG